MQFLLLVLNKVELLETLLERFVDQGVKGATILNSVGMARELADYPIFGSLRFLMDSDRQESKTIFMVLKDEQVETVKETVREVIGDLSKPDTAVMFTLPVLTIEGVEF